MEKEKIFKKHDDRNDLAEGHPYADLGQAILLLVFLVVWITDSFFVKYSILFSDYSFLFIRIPLAMAVLFIAVYLAKQGLSFVYSEVRNKPSVIRKGVFGIVRHPVYLGAILLYPVFLLVSLSIIATLIWIIVILFYCYLCKYEEKQLLKKYGKEYEIYVTEVPMLFPRPIKHNSQ